MKHLFFTLSFALIARIANGQNEKTTIGILPFSYSSFTNERYVETINEMVESAFVKANRQTIVSRLNFGELKGEIERNKGAEFIDGKAVSQGKQFGAQYLVKGHVLTVEVTKSYDNSTKSYSYNSIATLSVKVLDVETGAIVAGEVIRSTGGGIGDLLKGNFSSDNSEEASVTAAFRNLTDKVYAWVTKNFKASLSIIKLERNGKDVMVLVSGGSDIGLRSGSSLKIVELEVLEVNGKKLTREIDVAKLKVSKIEGTNFSLCKITDGEDEFLKKYEDKSPLKVITVK